MLLLSTGTTDATAARQAQAQATAATARAEEAERREAGAVAKLRDQRELAARHGAGMARAS